MAWRVLLLCAVLPVVYGISESTRRQAESALEFEQSSLAMGVAWAQDGLRHDVTVLNKSSRDIEVVSATASCSCTAISPSAFVIPANSEHVISLTLDLRTYLTPDKASCQPFEVSIVLQDRSGVNYLGKLSGSVQKAFSVNDLRLLLGADDAVVVGESHSLTATEVYPTEEVIGWKVDAGRDIDARIISREARSFLEITPSAQLAAGGHDISIHIQALLRNQHSCPPVTIPLRLEISRNILLLPECVDFGTRVMGTSASQVLTVQSRSKNTVKVTGVDPDPGINASIEPSIQPDSARILVDVPFNEVGNAEHAIVVWLLDENGTSSLARVPVRYYGVKK